MSPLRGPSALSASDPQKLSEHCLLGDTKGSENTLVSAEQCGNAFCILEIAVRCAVPCELRRLQQSRLESPL